MLVHNKLPTLSKQHINAINFKWFIGMRSHHVRYEIAELASFA